MSHLVLPKQTAYAMRQNRKTCIKSKNKIFIKTKVSEGEVSCEIKKDAFWFIFIHISRNIMCGVCDSDQLYQVMYDNVKIITSNKN